MVAILILNWNGWQDTIECLSSLFKIDYDDYFVVLGDNGSTNESKNKILSYCQTIDSSVQWITNSPERFVGRQSRKKEIFLLDLEKNHGFAKGNNYLSTFAMTFSPNYYLLLNNDTEVEPDFLTKLVEYQISHKEFHVLTPLIHYFYDKELIWNGGGNLIWGIRKYHYADQQDSVVREKEFIPCTFITGCALFCTQDILMPDGKIFIESFFHGEEDFDFGLRMREREVKMGCVVKSVIYHKVGRSSSKTGNKIGLSYCYYLNRFINLRHHLNFISYYSFLLIYAPYVVQILMKQKISFIKALYYYGLLLKESHQLDGVNREKFLQCANLK